MEKKVVPVLIIISLLILTKLSCLDQGGRSDELSSIQVIEDSKPELTQRHDSDKTAIPGTHLPAEAEDNQNIADSVEGESVLGTLRDKLLSGGFSYKALVKSSSIEKDMQDVIDVLEDFANESDELLLLSHAYSSKENYEKALAVLEEVEEKEELGYERSLHKMDLLFSLGRWQEAKEGYLILKDVAPDDKARDGIKFRLNQADKKLSSAPEFIPD